MTPKVAARGGSFRGAARYYLHDKGAETDRRVAFCMTRNLPTEEPELAWRWMAYTASNAHVLKQEAGVKATGKKMEKPVYTFSLSWDPKERVPTNQEMIGAAESGLKMLGLDKHQALLVSHNDEPHPHIHAIVNLVDPDNGKIRDPGFDRLKFSRWAESYERMQGQIRCPQRVENNARRDRGEIVKDTKSLSRQDIEQRQKIEKDLLKEKKAQLWDRQLADRDTLKKAAQERAARVQGKLKEKFKPAWAALFKKQREDKRQADKARQSVLAALRVALKERRRLSPDGRAGFGTILKYAVNARALGQALIDAGAREKEQVKARRADERRELVKGVWDKYEREFEALKKEQAQARAELATTPSQPKKDMQAAPEKETGPPKQRGLRLPDVRHDFDKPETDAERRKRETHERMKKGADEMLRRRDEARTARDKGRDAPRVKTPSPEEREQERERARQRLKERDKLSMAERFRKGAEELTKRGEQKKQREKERPPDDRDRER